MIDWFVAIGFAVVLVIAGFAGARATRVTDDDGPRERFPARYIRPAIASSLEGEPKA